VPHSCSATRDPAAPDPLGVDEESGVEVGVVDPLAEELVEDAGAGDVGVVLLPEPPQAVSRASRATAPAAVRVRGMRHSPRRGEARDGVRRPHRT
jgi:hypothetical protein